MSSELKVNGATSGATIYAVIENEAGQLWKVSTSTFEVFNAANWANYKVALTEQTGTGRFRGNFPTGIKASGLYNVEYRIQSGGTPVVADVVKESRSIDWSGGELTSLKDISDRL